jgi:hypothetical protein
VILIAYDGSADAQAAIEHAGELLSGEPAIVLTVWRTVDETPAVRIGSTPQSSCMLSASARGTRAMERPCSRATVSP